LDVSSDLLNFAALSIETATEKVQKKLKNFKKALKNA